MPARQISTATAVAALLLLTACGGSDDGDDPIAGVEESAEESPSEDAEEPTGEETRPADDGRPEINLPEDVELVFDWETPADPDEATALSDAANYIRSIALGVVEQDPDHPIYQGYSTGAARDYARTQIGLWVDGGWTMHGTDRFYAPEIRRPESGDTIGVEFCHDESQMLGKDAETGEALPPTEYEGDEHLYHYTIVMAPAPGVEGFWQAQGVEVEEEAAQCRE
ncbi:hypothetical protein [Streptomyces litchfieldiae]|uniref:Lipoprotein n=1 Tax=Streptomyces litchfieldiae TaxID=3075543 RepID=A0ABU2MWY5_9ACTN|nr:hypothetical protein [Streptomyces sp. DSM 44938]MDT0346162.1 hypothetical protein [Streptomyces sp. DSM 44938]